MPASAHAPASRLHEVPLCPVCGGPGSILHRDVLDGFGLTQGTWTFRGCEAGSCGHAWLDPAPDPETLANAYAGYPVHADDPSPTQPAAARTLLGSVYHGAMIAIGLKGRRRRIERLYLPKRGGLRVLEVGCGSGARLERLRALGHDVEGQDLMPGSAKVAARHGLRVHVGDLEILPLAPGSYDAVVLHHVLEHVRDPVATLRRCHDLVRPGGQVLSVHPNGASRLHERFGNDWVGLDAPRHLHVFTPGSSREAARRAGFQRPRTATTTVRTEAWARTSLIWAARNAKAPAPSESSLNRAAAVAQLRALVGQVVPGHGDEIILKLRRRA